MALDAIRPRPHAALILAEHAPGPEREPEAWENAQYDVERGEALLRPQPPRPPRFDVMNGRESQDK